MSVTDRSLVAVHLLPRDAAAVIYDTWGAGGAVLPLDPQLSPPTALSFAAAQGATTLVGARGTEAIGAGQADAELGAVVFTSGTTGAPKAVELTTRALEHAATLSNDALGAEPGDRWLCCLPLHHIAGLAILARGRALGAPPLVLDRFDVSEVAAADAALVSLVPTTLARLLDAGADVSHFKAILLGGAMVPPGLLTRAADAGAHVVRSYGMTETCGGVVYDGVPLPGVCVRVGDHELGRDATSGEGRIAISSPTLMRRYRGQREPDAEWFETNDIGAIRAGRLEVVGRADDIIITGGEKVAPATVERALLGLDRVADALVVGVQDDEWGQRVVAFVVAPGADARSLAGSLKGRLTSHEIPKDVVLVDAIPRTATGKPIPRWVQDKTPD